MKIKQTVLIFTTLLLLIAIFFINNNLKQQYSDTFKKDLIEQTFKDLSNNFDKSFYKNLYNIQTIASKTLNSLNIKSNITNIDLNYISSNDRYLSIYNDKGELLYTSVKDNMIFETSKHLKYFLKYNSNFIDFEITHFNATISSITPIKTNNKLIYMVLNMQFDEILKDLQDIHIEPIVVLNHQYSQYIDPSLSYSRKFIKNYYIINNNANKYYIKLLEQADIFDKQQKEYYSKKSNIIVVKKELYSSYLENFADIYLVKSIDELDFSQLDKTNLYFNIAAFILGIIILLINYIIYSNIKNKDIVKTNINLLNENKELRVLSDKLDYNEKKLSNLFNLQPNIMFISNGVEIVQVNKRFMGFFRRYGTFKEFKKHHKDIAELFEPCNKPHYISSSLIDGKHWLEYILENPKQLYKAVMSVNNEPHHFIIKVNEMEYMKNFHERYIVVAFVDITQDINKKKDDKHSNHPIIIQNDELDISYLIEKDISDTIYELTNLIPSKQAIFKAHLDDLENLNLVCFEVSLINDPETLNWQIILPITTLSYLHNILISDYDGKIVDQLNKDIEDIANTFVDALYLNLIDSIEELDQNKLKNLSYKKQNSYLIDTDLVDVKNLYKFDLFLEEQELQIFINFDQHSFKYIKQIQMLGMFFG